MNEKDFISEFISALNLTLPPCLVATHKSLLYDLSIDDDGRIRMGVDTDSGEPLRGRGKGFEQDILLYDVPGPDGHQVVPRVVAEVKFNAVTTHDVLVYSEKARRIRAIYPYLRYGLILGGFRWLPSRVLRLGQNFDFMFSISHPFAAPQIAGARVLFAEEVQASRDVARIAFGKERVSFFRRRVQHDSKPPNKAPEPTPGSVTLRAPSRMAESKLRNAVRHVARSAPVPGVAHL